MATKHLSEIEKQARITAVMFKVTPRCNALVAEAYLEAEEWDIEDAVISYNGDHSDKQPNQPK